MDSTHHGNIIIALGDELYVEEEMGFITQRFLWFFLIVSVLLGIAWQFYPLPNAQHRLESLPLHGKNYQGHNIPLTKVESTILTNVNVLKRLYHVEGATIFVTVLDGTHNRHVVHDPYYCFKGSGWRILNKILIPSNKGYAARVKLVKETKEKEAHYWFSDGRSQYSSPLRYWWQATLRRLTLGLSGPEPILIVVQPHHTEKVDWDNIITNFPELFEL